MKMAIIRVIYPAIDGWKLMRIYDIVWPTALAVPPACTKMMAEEWDASVAGIGGVEQDYIDALQITEVADMR
jgi:hypothetical protein